MQEKIVILGAGFGGIKTAFLLCRKLKRLGLENKYELILVDKNRYHTYTPTLYEVATTSKDLANHLELKNIVTFDLKTIFQNKKISILNATVAQLDLTDGDIHFQNGNRLKFDYLVLALGSETNYFNIPGLKENSLTLKTFKDAIQIRDAIWNQVDKGVPKGGLKIVIGGGGSTGVELAGEIKSWLCELDEEFKKCPASVTVIEGMPTILPGFNEKIVKKVTCRLKEIEIGLVLNELVASVKPKKIRLKSGQTIDFDIFIWTGGVKAISLMGDLPLHRETKGRVQTTEEMECLPQSPDLRLYGQIYGLGDAICFYDPTTNRPIPLLAEAAIQEAKVVAHNIIEDIKFSEGLSKNAQHKKYLPGQEYPYIIPVGGKYAAAKFGPLIIWSFPGWVLKGLVELYYLLFNALPPLQALKIWLKGLWIFIKNDRLG